MSLSSSSAASASALSHFWFPIDNSRRDPLISLKLHRRVQHHKIQVKFEKGVIHKLFELSYGPFSTYNLA